MDIPAAQPWNPLGWGLTGHPCHPQSFRPPSCYCSPSWAWSPCRGLDQLSQVPTDSGAAAGDVEVNTETSTWRPVPASRPHPPSGPAHLPATPSGHALFRPRPPSGRQPRSRPSWSSCRSRSRCGSTGVARGSADRRWRTGARCRSSPASSAPSCRSRSWWAICEGARTEPGLTWPGRMRAGRSPLVSACWLSPKPGRRQCFDFRDGKPNPWWWSACAVAQPTPARRGASASGFSRWPRQLATCESPKGDQIHSIMDGVEKRE